MEEPKIVPCKDCGKSIIWALSPRGERIPLDTKAVIYDLRLCEGREPLAVKMDQGFVSHFATCPKANSFSGKALKEKKETRARGDDVELIEALKEIDASDVQTSTWEADFLESVLYKRNDAYPLSEKQKKAARSMIGKYLEDKES